MPPRPRTGTVPVSRARPCVKDCVSAVTHQALAKAALGLADRLGPDRVTVEAIADAAGVSPRTFFNYFSSKEDAIVGIAPAQSSALLADLLSRPDDEPPLGALRAVVLAAAERLQAGGDDWVIRHRLIQKHHSLAVPRAAWFAEVERRMAEEIARRTGLDPGLDVYPRWSWRDDRGPAGAIDVWQERGRAGALETLIDGAFDVLAHGLGSPTPSARLPSDQVAGFSRCVAKIAPIVVVRAPVSPHPVASWDVRTTEVRHAPRVL